MERLTLDDVLSRLQAENEIQEVEQADRVLGGAAILNCCHDMTA